MKLFDCLTGSEWNPAALLLLAGLAFTVWILWRVHRNARNSIDLSELLIDSDGKASWTKITAIGAFIVASWAFAFMTLHDKMTEWLFLFYVAVYSGAPVAYRFIATRTPPEQPADK
jgi:hypothetical protein